MVMITRDVSERPSKRRCVQQKDGGDEDWKPGRILEIEAVNFMTYDHIKSTLGPSLNLIIGPNGTGKSSIVCAIGIGLAGDTQVLGRAGQLGEYVKRGEDSGWIKITLQGDTPGEVHVVTRKINKRNKSDWLFNDHVATKREIVENVSKYNIQLNNLTQFLPQDRVCEFAKMNPVDILRETEKAVGDPELSANHKRLIEKNKEMTTLKHALDAHESLLARATASNKELEAEKERMQERTSFLDRARALKKKIPWLKYEQRKGSFEESREREREAKMELENVQIRARDAKRAFEPMKAKRDSAKAANDKLLQKRVQKERNLRSIANNEKELDAQVRAKQGEIQDLRRKEVTRREKLERGQKSVQDALAEVENLPPSVSHAEALGSLASQLQRIRNTEHDKNMQTREKRQILEEQIRADDFCVRRLQDINNSKLRLLQTLRNNGASGIVNAYDWVQSHRHEFQREVFGPILLEVQIPNKEHAAFVEQHVAGYLWRAFVTQTPADRDILMRNLKKYRVPVINPKEGHFRPPPIEVTSEMKRLGVLCRLDEVIEAPDAVKSLLIGQANLDRSLIGDAEANRRADEVVKLGVRDLWTRENHYRWQESRYGGHMSTSVKSVGRPRLFSENVDTSEKAELENKRSRFAEEINFIKGEVTDLQSQAKDLRDEAAGLEAERDRLYKEGAAQKRRENETRHNYEKKVKALSILEEAENLADAEGRCNDEIEQIHKDRVQNLLNLQGSIEEVTQAQILYAAAHLQAADIDTKVKELSTDVQKHEDETRDAETTYTRWKAATEHSRSQLQEAKNYAERQAPLTPELKQAFDEMPETTDELEEKIAECEAHAAAVICNNENAVLIYEQRCEEIRNLTLKTEEKKAAHEKCSHDIERIQSLWLPQLRELVSNINTTYSQNFREMAVAGEVSLDEHGTNFDEYGILIKTQFRENGKLQVLSAQHQSGGERSVATILYLISLQDLTYCPFRVVDEINQGMDPHNERKMFTQLVRAASRPNTSQCLLLTPKLLSDLTYSESCTIINVMNGPWINDPATSNCRDGRPWSQMSQPDVALHFSSLV